MTPNPTYTNPLSSQNIQPLVPFWAPDPFRIPEIIQQIFNHLSLNDLFNFEGAQKGHSVLTPSIWRLFGEKKGFLYHFTSPCFQSSGWLQDKTNYLLSQAIENLMNALPKKRQIQKTFSQLQPLGEKFPLFHAFINDILAVQSQRMYLQCKIISDDPQFKRHIHNFKGLYPSATPLNRPYKDELLLHTLFKLYHFSKLTPFSGPNEGVFDQPKELLALSSKAISAGATFISRLSVTLIKNHKKPHYSTRFREFLRILAQQAKEKGDHSGQEKFILWAEKVYPHAIPYRMGSLFADHIPNGANTPRLLYQQHYEDELSSEEEVQVSISLDYLKDYLKQPTPNDHWSIYRLLSLFPFLIEIKQYELANLLIEKNHENLIKCSPYVLLGAIKTKMHFNKLDEANHYYDIIIKKTTLNKNLYFLNSMAKLKFQLKDYAKADTCLMKYWNKKEWHNQIIYGSKNYKWIMNTVDAFKNEELRKLMKGTIAIKEKLNDQEGANFFRNLFVLSQLNLKNVPACKVAHRKWKRERFYDKAGQEWILPYLLYAKMVAVICMAQQKAVVIAHR